VSEQSQNLPGQNLPSQNLPERRLSDGLVALAESEAPAAAVSVAGVIESGRDALRRRRVHGAFAMSAALVGAAALAVGVVAAIGHGGGGPASAAHGSASPSESASRSATTEPVSPTVAFGWLPAALNGEYEASYYAYGPNYKGGIDPASNLPADNGPGGYGVQVLAPGDVILTASLSGPGSGTDPGMKFNAPAGTVQGHQAWWTTGAPGSSKAAGLENLVLMWQYEPDAWASVVYHGNTGTASGTMLLHVADELVIGKQNPITLPFRMAPLPDGLHVDAIDEDLPKQNGATVGSAAVRLCLQSPCAVGSLVISQDSATWQSNSTFENYDAPLPNPGTAYTTVTVDGHTAQLRTKTGAATLTFGYDGTKVEIAASGAQYTALGGKDGFLTFCRSLTWLGANPAQWTSQLPH
jgi:hypothetical protein